MSIRERLRVAFQKRGMVRMAMSDEEPLIEAIHQEMRVPHNEPIAGGGDWDHPIGVGGDIDFWHNLLADHLIETGRDAMANFIRQTLQSGHRIASHSHATITPEIGWRVFLTPGGRTFAGGAITLFHKIADGKSLAYVQHTHDSGHPESYPEEMRPEYEALQRETAASPKPKQMARGTPIRFSPPIDQEKANAFIRGIRENPADSTRKLAYSDFLEESGRTRTAHNIRTAERIGSISNPDGTPIDQQGLLRLGYRFVIPAEGYVHTIYAYGPGNRHVVNVNGHLGYSLHGQFYLAPDHMQARQQIMSRGTPIRLLKPVAQQNTAGALQAAGSGNQAALAKVLSQVLNSMNLRPHTVQPALHDLITEVRPSAIAAVYKQVPDEAVNYSAAWSGLISRQSAMLAFRGDPQGQDSLYHLRLQGSGEQLHQALNAAKIGPRVLIPGESGFDALIYDQGRKQRPQVAQFAQAAGIRVNESRGVGQVVGAADDGEGRAAQRKIIRGVENQGQQMRKRAVLVRIAWTEQDDVVAEPQLVQTSRRARFRNLIRMARLTPSPIPSNAELAGAHQEIKGHSGISGQGMTYTMPDGRKFYAKRLNAPVDTRQQMQVHSLAQRVGVQTHPIEVRRGLPGVENMRHHSPTTQYAVMPHIGGRNLSEQEYDYPRSYLPHPEQLIHGHVFRYAVGDDDANKGNWMLDTHGNIHSIDHEFAFSHEVDPDDYHVTKDLASHTPIDPEFVRGILKHEQHFLAAVPHPGDEVTGPARKGADLRRKAMAGRLNVLKKFLRNGDYTRRGLVQAHEDHVVEGEHGNDENTED